jgi:D-lactate dehydrogenase
MKLFVYGYRPYDEAAAFQRYAQKFQVTLGYSTEPPSMENAALSEGFDCISIVSTPMPRELIVRFRALGIRMISTRTVGYDHIDLETAKTIGMHVSNASYSPDCVADYTVMLMLMALRRMKRIMQRADIHDFSLPGTIGKELRDCTVGVVGTGKIGKAVLRDLSGFGCKLLAYSRTPDPTLGVFYVPLEQILRESDVLTFHLPLNADSYHMIDHSAIANMKDGVILVNTARGAIISTEALIEGLECGKIGGAALDVLEDEAGLFHFDKKSDQISHRAMSILKDMPNVIFTPHMAFYTQEAIGDMVGHSLESCVLELTGKENPWHII